MADPDYLKECQPERVARWYKRLADAWIAHSPHVKPALAGIFLQTWVENRNPHETRLFNAPAHVRESHSARDVQRFHRDVFLTARKGRFANGVEKWAGILPRLQGSHGYPKWDGRGDLPLEYESLCDIAPNVFAIYRIQRSGTMAERAILGSLRGFQLKSKVVLALRQQTALPSQVYFKSWLCSGTDRYDWNYSEHLTVANPDFGSTDPDAIQPQLEMLTVYHSNAKRLEDAKLAAPYNVVLREWTVHDAGLLAPTTLDLSRRL